MSLLDIIVKRSEKFSDTRNNSELYGRCPVVVACRFLICRFGSVLLLDCLIWAGNVLFGQVAGRIESEIFWFE